MWILTAHTQDVITFMCWERFWLLNTELIKQLIKMRLVLASLQTVTRALNVLVDDVLCFICSLQRSVKRTVQLLQLQQFWEDIFL